MGGQRAGLSGVCPNGTLYASLGKPAQICMLLGARAVCSAVVVACSALGGNTRRGYVVHVVLAGKVAVPCADGCSLRHRPLLRGLPARTDNAPYLLFAARGKHGLQVNIGSTASKAGADCVWIKFFHVGSIPALLWHHKDCICARVLSHEAGRREINFIGSQSLTLR